MHSFAYPHDFYDNFDNPSHLLKNKSELREFVEGHGWAGFGPELVFYEFTDTFDFDVQILITGFLRFFGNFLLFIGVVMYYRGVTMPKTFVVSAVFVLNTLLNVPSLFIINTRMCTDTTAYIN